MRLMGLIAIYPKKDLSKPNTEAKKYPYLLKAITVNKVHKYSNPAISNSHQGSQFTSNECTALLEQNQIRISRDGKGRSLDNIFIERFWHSLKYEHIYLNPATDGLNLYKGIHHYIQH
jgi:putative transposase